MFDIDLHFRFLRKAAEAYFEFGQASVAAATAWQRQVHAQFCDERPPTYSQQWPTWFGYWPSAFENYSYSSNYMAPIYSAWRTAASWPQPSASMPNFFWPMATNTAIPYAPYAFATNFIPWGAYQAPMIAMLVSSGVPYAVAAPTARAQTSAMDAADAAYSQWRLIFGDNEVPIDRDRARRALSSNRKS